MEKTDEKDKYKAERDRELRETAWGRLMENAPQT